MNTNPWIQALDPATFTAMPVQAFANVNGDASGLGVQLMAQSGGGTAIAVNAGAVGAMTLKSCSNALMVTPPGNWSEFHAPAAATVASVTRAGVIAQKHVCTSITFTLTNDAAAQTAPVSVVLRDGDPGVGAILWQASLRGGANAGGVIAISGLAIIGSYAASMTLETLTAPDANHFVTVAMTGYDAG